MRYQPIYDIAELCMRKNIDQVVLCPGSRCAPLTLAFTRHPKITTRTFSDERSAGFIALGMAQQLQKPVVLVCTSGTAVYNLAPAIAEAFFSHTPLVVLTADRPAAWIAQQDGQTIHQTEIFGRHVKKYFELPQDYEHPDNLWAINRMINEALNLSFQSPAGPVHINAPFREPLYPDRKDTIQYTSELRILEEHTSIPVLSPEIKAKVEQQWMSFRRVLVVAGQHLYNSHTLHSASQLQRKHAVPVVHDIISNLHEVENAIRHADLFLAHASEELKETLRPDLLITFGNSVVSKNLKIFMRRYPAKNHWHIQLPGPVADTFKNLTEVFPVAPHHFLDFLSSLDQKSESSKQDQEHFLDAWQAEEVRTSKLLNEFFEEEVELNELSLVNRFLNHLPEKANLHLANSMSVRYANFIGLEARQKKGIRVFSNRGTSGIDGCTSTAVGHSLVSGEDHFLITGDLAFFYDRNAFWHNYDLQNLRILLLNNHGGLIFDVLEGPSSMPEAEEYFITRQRLNAQALCREFGFDYMNAESPEALRPLFENFSQGSRKTKILELETDTTLNKKALERLKLKIKKSYEL
jgi:2-succinyl-5-enolpyruvyl-6-hydroxy-3-cyclohexene-1-carboxylate synthase